jgi:hypothetical protein
MQMGFDVTSISAIVAAAGVIVGVMLTLLELRHLGRQRQTDLIMNLHSQTCTKEFVEAYKKVLSLEFKEYDDFEKKYGPLNAEGPEQIAIMMCANFMEGIGVLLHRRLVDIEPLRELFPIEAGWRKLGPILIHSRKKSGNPETWQWFEYLYNEAKKREQTLQQSKA